MTKGEKRDTCIYVGEHPVEPEVRKRKYITDGICRDGCTSLYVRSHGSAGSTCYCKALDDKIIGPGSACIPWLRHFRYMFERMFEACGCPTCDHDPVEWIQHMYDRLGGQYTEIERMKRMVGRALELLEEHTTQEIHDEYQEFCIQLAAGEHDDLLKEEEDV